MKKAIILSFVIFASAGVCFAQTKKVESFISDGKNIDVFFYDPLLRLAAADNDFQSRSDKEKSDALDKYLHENPLYLFRSTSLKTGEVIYFCIRGNPEKLKTKMFYKVEVIKAVPADFDPNTANYSGKVVLVIDKVNCGGTLFENMSLFDDEKNKQYIGNGIQLFGLFRRIQPYGEIRTSMTNIIEAAQ